MEWLFGEFQILNGIDGLECFNGLGGKECFNGD